MYLVVSHDRADESPEAKARWFQGLSLQERMALLCAYYELILAANPRVADLKDAQPVEGRIRVLTEA